MKKTELYTIWATGKARVTMEIQALSLEDALEQARKLQMGDFLEKGCFENCENFEIQGLLK